MSRDLSAIYNAEFFESYNEEQEADIRAAADVLWEVFHPATALDVGCGPGMLVRRLRELGCYAYGSDGSTYAIEKAHSSVRPYLAVIDVTHPINSVHGASLVICTEVAEHVPETDADELVHHLTDHSACWIVFTAAPPGQGGHDHCNEQPMSYWIAKFNAHGFEVDEVLTATVKAGWSHLKRMWFYPANVRVFRRVT